MRPAKDSKGDQAPGWTPQTSPQASEHCSHCLLTASRYIGPDKLCDACYDYQKRTGRPRPRHLIDRAPERRYQLQARRLEIDQLRANKFRNDILLDSHTDRSRVDYLDGVNREVSDG